MRTLRTEDLDLLREVIGRRKPSLVQAVDSLGGLPLTDEQRDELRDALADELSDTGLLPNDEPNERGLKLDALIGKLMDY